MARHARSIQTLSILLFLFLLYLHPLCWPCRLLYGVGKDLLMVSFRFFNTKSFNLHLYFPFVSFCAALLMTTSSVLRSHQRGFSADSTVMLCPDPLLLQSALIVNFFGQHFFRYGEENVNIVSSCTYTTNVYVYMPYNI